MSNATKTAAAPAKLTFQLQHPIAYNGETISELPYRRPKGRDMRKFLNTVGSGNRYTAMAVDLCELPEKVFDELMDGNDYYLFTEVLDTFFRRGPATSTTSSPT